MDIDAIDQVGNVTRPATFFLFHVIKSVTAWHLDLPPIRRLEGNTYLHPDRCSDAFRLKLK